MQHRDGVCRSWLRSCDLPSSTNEKLRKDGMTSDSLLVEWLILRHFLLNQPSSAWNKQACVIFIHSYFSYFKTVNERAISNKKLGPITWRQHTWMKTNGWGTVIINFFFLNKCLKKKIDGVLGVLISNQINIATFVHQTGYMWKK